jgi:hypothetical protein
MQTFDEKTYLISRSNYTSENTNKLFTCLDPDFMHPKNQAIIRRLAPGYDAPNETRYGALYAVSDNYKIRELLAMLIDNAITIEQIKIARNARPKIPRKAVKKMIADALETPARNYLVRAIDEMTYTQMINSILQYECEACTFGHARFFKVFERFANMEARQLIDLYNFEDITCLDFVGTGVFLPDIRYGKFFENIQAIKIDKDTVENIHDFDDIEKIIIYGVEISKHDFRYAINKATYELVDCSYCNVKNINMISKKGKILMKELKDMD